MATSNAVIGPLAPDADLLNNPAAGSTLPGPIIAPGTSGLIANRLENGSTTYGAGTRDVAIDPALGTVAGQLHSLLKSGSPYLDAARSGALETANARGLINSSMAAGAGEAAAIDKALPIAQQDSATQNQVNEFNAGATNTANLNAAQTASSSELAGQAADLQANKIIPAQTAASKELQSQAGTIQSGLSAQAASQTSTLQTEASAQRIAQLSAQGEIDKGLQVLKGSQATDLANIDVANKMLMQTNASAASLFNVANQQIQAILGDPNTSLEQKQAAVTSITNTLHASLSVLGGISNLDLGKLVDWGTPESGPTAAATPVGNTSTAPPPANTTPPPANTTPPPANTTPPPANTTPPPGYRAALPGEPTMVGGWVPISTPVTADRIRQTVMSAGADPAKVNAMLTSGQFTQQQLYDAFPEYSPQSIDVLLHPTPPATAITQEGAGSNEPAYFQQNPDVAAAYAADSQGMTPEQYTLSHYNAYGVHEGRAAP